MFTERKFKLCHDGEEKWINIDRFKLNGRYKYYDDGSEERQFEVVPIYDDRDYRLFTMLAGVRNYHDDPVISNPKGFPFDCSDFVNEEKENWEGDGHSHSYLTLKELKDFRSKAAKYVGFMMPEDVLRDLIYRLETGLIERLEKRTRDEFWLLENEDTTEYDDKVRIVFWFDN